MNYETQTKKERTEMKEVVLFINNYRDEKTEMKELNQESDLDTIQEGDYRKVYDHECICTYKSDSFVTFHALLKGGKIGVKNTAFLKVELDHVDGYEWKNIYLSCTLKTRRTLSGFVNK